MNRTRATSLLAAVVITTTAAPAYALKPVRDYVALPSDYGIVARDVSFKTKDGLTIQGWFFPAQDTTGIANQMIGHWPVEPALKRPGRPYATLDGRPRPTVVVCDGDAVNMSQFILYAYNLCTRGFNVLTFDWRGFGRSDPWPIEQDHLCHTEFLTDYHAALDFVRRQPEVDSTRIGVFGLSTGAYLSFAIAAQRGDVAAFAGRALMTSFDEVLPLVRRLKPDRKLVAPGDYPRALLPIRAAKRLRIPVFLIVGEKDDRTPPSMSTRILAELKGTKELWIVPGATHGGEDGPDLKNYPEFFVRLAEFFRRNM